MKTTTLLLATTLLASCQSAGTAPGSAPDPTGVYGKAFAGAGLLQDDDIIFTEGGGGQTTGDGSFDAGTFGGVAVGYRFDENWAAELEYTFRTNDLDSFSAGGSELAGGGDFASTAIMLNGFYHFDTDWRLDPYVGIGFGTANEVDIDIDGPGAFSGGRSFSADSPAAQFMVGGTGALTDDLGFFVEGRFMRAFDPDMSEEGGAGNVESEYGHFGLLLGLQYAF